MMSDIIFMFVVWLICLILFFIGLWGIKLVEEWEKEWEKKREEMLNEKKVI